MMEIEKKFATADLSSLKDAPIKMFAKACIQYQDFKTKKAFERFDYKTTGWSESTAIATFDCIVAYLKYGSPSTLLTPKIKQAVDEVVASNRYRALIPAKGDARRILAKKDKQTTNSIQVPVIRKSASEPVKVNAIKAIQHFLYAVSSNNLFYTFKTETECNSFIQGVKFANPNAEIKLQKISIVED